MRVPVVISTGLGRTAWVAQSLDSIWRGNVTIARSDGGREVGAIRMIYEQTRWRRWLMLQDSVEVLDQDLFRLADEVDGPCLLAPHPCMYLAVFERSVLDGVWWPTVVDQESAIEAEAHWMRAYEDEAHAQGFACPVLFPDFTDESATRQEERHGRNNLVLENAYLRKWKGTWRP